MNNQYSKGSVIFVYTMNTTFTNKLRKSMRSEVLTAMNIKNTVGML